MIDVIVDEKDSFLCFFSLGFLRFDHERVEISRIRPFSRLTTSFPPLYLLSTLFRVCVRAIVFFLISTSFSYPTLLFSFQQSSG